MASSDNHPAPVVEVRILSTLAELTPVDDLFVQVWGAGNAALGIELLRALAHAGGYVSGAFVGGELVGASAAFRADHQGPALHSHVTAVLPAAQGIGIGLILKQHQREWAMANGIGLITWTFDPLIRRNAWFNLRKLGARPDEYLVDFYGPMDDDINGGDESDRVFAVWRLAEVAHHPASAELRSVPEVLREVDGRPVVVPDTAKRVLLGTPPDIEKLRRTDPALAREWRLAMREQLGAALAHGSVIGFTETGHYVIERAVEENR